MNRKASTTSAAAKAFRKVLGPKKRNKLRKVSNRPTKALNDRANRALQDWYRWNYRDRDRYSGLIQVDVLCEACGKPFEVMHHFIEKSQSIGLRFEPDNLIFLCHGCHFRHHRTGDQSIMQNVILGRGLAWLKKIRKMKLERQRGAFSKSELEALIEKYKT